MEEASITEFLSNEYKIYLLKFCIEDEIILFDIDESCKVIGKCINNNTEIKIIKNTDKCIKQNISHEKNWKEFLEAFSFRMMNSYHFSSQNSNHLFSEDSKKYDYFGPNLPIPPGEYLFAIHITSPEKNGIKAQIELLKENDKSTLKSEVLSLEKDETFQFKFNIPKNKKTTRYSFIIRCNKGKFIIKDFSLKKR